MFWGMQVAREIYTQPLNGCRRHKIVGSDSVTFIKFSLHTRSNEIHSQCRFWRQKSAILLFYCIQNQGRFVYGIVELQHPQSPLHLIAEIRYK